jgi:hypothetical protein
MLLLKYYLWIAPHVLLGVFLWLFLRRNLQRQFPFLFAYVLFQLFDFLAAAVNNVLVALDPKHSLTVYRWIMVWDLGIIALITLGVIYELVNEMVLARSTLAQTLRPIVRWGSAGLLLVIAATSGRLAVAGVERVMNTFQVLDFSASVLLVGLLLILFLFSRVLRISWRSFPVGIAIGLGIVGCAELSASGLLSVLGARRYVAIDVLRMAAFHACVLVWLAYLVLPERRPKFAGKPLKTAELDSWDQELRKMVRR